MYFDEFVPGQVFVVSKIRIYVVRDYKDRGTMTWNVEGTATTTRSNSVMFSIQKAGKVRSECKMDYVLSPPAEPQIVIENSYSFPSVERWWLDTGELEHRLCGVTSSGCRVQIWGKLTNGNPRD